MILSITKQFFIILSSIYLYRKLLNFKNFSVKKQFFNIIYACIVTIMSHFFTLYIPSLSLIFIVLSIYLIMSLQNQISLRPSFVTTVIAYSLSYITFCIGSILIIFIYYGLHIEKNFYSSLIAIILSGILCFSVLHIPFCFKRLRNGMRFLYHSVFINLGTIICITSLIFFSAGRLHEFPGDATAFLLLLSIFLLGFLLLFWWKNQITKSYIEKLRKAELESLRQELTEKNLEIQKLRENNDALAHIIHRDNKLIPSMEHAVCEFLDNKDTLPPDELTRKGEALAKELNEMAASRIGILHDYQAHGQRLPITGVCSVDALLSYMQKKAFSAGITFEAGISADLTAFTTSVVAPEDLSHLLSDLIENAIHAVKDCPDRKIQLHIHNILGNYAIEISDTGTPFPVEILQGLGIEQQTSHADDGGSGIGLMDIWNLKKKYRASLHIQEFDTASDTWCKKISVIFDSKNHYLIQTYRPEQILTTLQRSDLYVLQL